MGGAPARRIRYRNRILDVRPGETLLAAIARSGLPVLERSTRYRRPRAPFCGVGQCTGCLVRVNGRPLVRSCQYRPADGDRVEAAPGWPSPRFDLLGVVDYLFPRGLDPFHGFRRPAFAQPIYQRLVRRFSGYGPAPTAAVASAPPAAPTLRTVDVAVVGAGMSGAAAARRLVARGRRPLVLERSATATAIDGADLLTGATVTSLYPPDPSSTGGFSILGSVDDRAGLFVRAATVVVATGGYDAALLFGGNDRPGVMTAEAALALTEAEERTWFDRAALVGGDGRAEEVLRRFGPRIGSVVAFGEVRPEVVRAASDLEIPIYPRSLLLAARGRSRVRSVELRPRRGGPVMRVRCDAVVLAHRRLPNVQLLALAGAKMEWRAGTGAFFPATDDLGRTSVPGLLAVGEAAGVLPGARADSGERAADAVAGGTSDSVPPIPRVRATGPAELEGYYRELLREHRRGRTIGCRCEDVLLDDLERAHRAGYRGIEVVKRYTSLGTGLCQGRYCVAEALLLLAAWEGRAPEEVGTIRQRPPIFPTSLGALADLDAAVPREGP